MESERPTVGVASYEIKQSSDEGRLILHLVFDNPSGSCESYADFLRKFDKFLEEGGYAGPLIK